MTFTRALRLRPLGCCCRSKYQPALYAGTSKVTSDCLADILHHWWEANRQRFAHITTLHLNLDNGPECQSRRTQFLHRLVQFVQQTGLSVQLAYYPPYHSKYNPVERCWGVLENHWNGDWLDKCRCRGQVCPLHDLERQAFERPIYRTDLSHRREVEPKSYASPGNSGAPTTWLGQVVR